MTMSRHAEMRERQRGIKNDELITISVYGTWEKAKGGADIWKLSRREAARLIEEKKREINLIQRATRRRMVVKGGVVLTVY